MMKQYITMKKNENSHRYQIIERIDYRFGSLVELFSPYRWPNELIEWFDNEKKQSCSNEYISIRKQNGLISLYNLIDQFCDETSGLLIDLDSAKRFEMTSENFLEIIHQWDELRISRPDVILVVIHEDNHVSLETNQKIIKECQDAGYAFDINKYGK